MAKNYHKDEIDKLVNELLKEERQKFIKEHTPVVSTNYNNTYITIEKYDGHSEGIMDKIMKLLDLMDIQYDFSLISIGNEFFIRFDGDNSDRASFIQKFIDNGCRLSWT